jgi:hypothetical protein
MRSEFIHLMRDQSHSKLLAVARELMVRLLPKKMYVWVSLQTFHVDTDASDQHDVPIWMTRCQVDE